jgi:hypothetical protein
MYVYNTKVRSSCPLGSCSPSSSPLGVLPPSTWLPPSLAAGPPSAGCPPLGRRRPLPAAAAGPLGSRRRSALPRPARRRQLCSLHSPCRWTPSPSSRPASGPTMSAPARCCQTAPTCPAPPAPTPRRPPPPGWAHSSTPTCTCRAGRTSPPGTGGLAGRWRQGGAAVGWRPGGLAMARGGGMPGASWAPRLAAPAQR